MLAAAYGLNLGGSGLSSQSRDSGSLGFAPRSVGIESGRLGVIKSIQGFRESRVCSSQRRD
jgi:hypothetical protein